jgi:hypothetical protein
MDAKVKITGVNFWGIGIGKDRFEANSELADAGGIVALGTFTDAGNGFNITEREKPLAIVLKLNHQIGQCESNDYGTSVFSILQ